MRSIDLPLITGHKQGGKEGQALDVVSMRVADEDMAVYGLPACRHQICPSPWLPVPQSKTTSVPVAEQISTQDVLPP